MKTEVFTKLFLLVTFTDLSAVFPELSDQMNIKANT
jgi:hypothetical protein